MPLHKQIIENVLEHSEKFRDNDKYVFPEEDLFTLIGIHPSLRATALEGLKKTATISNLHIPGKMHQRSIITFNSQKFKTFLNQHLSTPPVGAVYHYLRRTHQIPMQSDEFQRLADTLNNKGTITTFYTQGVNPKEEVNVTAFNRLEKREKLKRVRKGLETLVSHALERKV